jgi:hypothetical protein
LDLKLILELHSRKVKTTENLSLFNRTSFHALPILARTNIGTRIIISLGN